MTSRFSFALCALSLLLAACPDPTPTPDSGTPPPPPPETGLCAETCAPYEKCDVASQTCVPGCEECTPDAPCVRGCSQNQVCTGDGAGNFACLEAATSCGGATCGPGQTACVDNQCTCLTERAASGDSCFATGRFCEGLRNTVTNQGGACRLPTLNEECLASPGCASGFSCTSGLCLRACNNPLDSSAVCGRDEACTDPDKRQAGADTCYWAGLFVGSDRENGCVGLTITSDGGTVLQEDGGLEWRYVAISNRCIPFPAIKVPVYDVNTQHPDYTTPLDPENLTGTCVPVPLMNADGTFNYTSCKRPGEVERYGRCSLDSSIDAGVTTCGTGLTCLPLAGANGFYEHATDEGICLDVCNAATPIAGVSPEPACTSGLTCMNYRRETDRLGVLGACTRPCNVFTGTAPSFGCTTEVNGSTSTTFACVPTEADGTAIVSRNGSGICVPPFNPGGTLASEGQPCAVSDAFLGASCNSGLVCVSSAAGAGTCRKPCDLECSKSSPPARCAGLTNVGCSGGRTCSAASADPLATTGICL